MLTKFYPFVADNANGRGWRLLSADSDVLGHCQRPSLDLEVCQVQAAVLPCRLLYYGPAGHCIGRLTAYAKLQIVGTNR
jgi:hypothetical protein